MSIADNLKNLSANELIVLRKRCEGMKSEEIAVELGYSVEWVWGEMGKVYKKLEFDKKVHWKQRVKILDEQVCPYLDQVPEIPSSLVPVVEPEPDPEMLYLVKFDERQLLKLEREKLPTPRRRRPILAIALITVCLLGTVTLSVLGYFYYPVAIALLTPQVVQVPLVITATPLPSPLALNTRIPVIPDTPLPPQNTPTTRPTATETLPPTPKPYYAENEAAPLEPNISVHLDRNFDNSAWWCHAVDADFIVKLIFVNETDNQFLIKWNTSTFHAVDDTGTQYELLQSSIYNYSELLNVDETYLMDSTSSVDMCLAFKGKWPLGAHYIDITADWINGVGPIVFRKDL